MADSLGPMAYGSGFYHEVAQLYDSTVAERLPEEAVGARLGQIESGMSGTDSVFLSSGVVSTLFHVMRPIRRQLDSRRKGNQDPTPIEGTAHSSRDFVEALLVAAHAEREVLTGNWCMTPIAVSSHSTLTQVLGQFARSQAPRL